MSLEIVLPLGNENNIKNIVFTILSYEYPLKLIELTNIIRKRYGKAVTFQAVRKACLSLAEDGVLQKGDGFSINKEWVKKSKLLIDKLYSDLNSKQKSTSNESIGGEVSVFTFSSLNELMKFWQSLIEDWFKNFKEGDYGINCYQAAHLWEGLLHSDDEKVLMYQLKKKGIKSYIKTAGRSPLDRQIAKFYQDIGIKTNIDPSSSFFDKSYYVGTYGDLIIQAKYPDEITKKLDLFFKKSKTLKDLNLVELSDIVNINIEMKLTVIRNISMAKQINKSILGQFN
jgi:hypothetical protein